MANKSIFASPRGTLIPQTDARNHHGALAYAMTPEHKLAQIAMTGTMNATFYAQGQDQLAGLLDAAQQVEPAFVAKTAIYARTRGHMKDAPALLMAWLSMVQTEHFSLAFDRVIDNGKMLRNFVQIMRSGATGRKSLGTRPKRMICRWLEQASDIEIMRAAVGQDPSLADVIKMVHPKPADASREAFYGWLIGKPYEANVYRERQARTQASLPQIVRDFEAFKADPSAELPDVPFQMLTARPLSKKHWAAIGRKAGWQMLRMNLATFARQNAFEVDGFAAHVAKRLRDPEAIKKARVLPYQLMAAHRMASRAKAMPEKVIDALHEAMEIAVGNVPKIEGRVVVCPDVSGSMSSPVTGHRRGATTAMRCIDVAALVAAAFLRANSEARVLPFEQKVVPVRIEPRDTVLTNARRLAAIGGGGTNCSAPIRQLVQERAKVDLVVMVSDNESWVDANPRGRGTALMEAWTELKRGNPNARLVCVDIQPYGRMQATNRQDILNVGGFSDEVFEMIAAFAKGKLGPRYWAGEIEKIVL
jgi:60 kDa SS-A/Ro ribonucleoprotein